MNIKPTYVINTKAPVFNVRIGAVNTLTPDGRRGVPVCLIEMGPGHRIRFTRRTILARYAIKSGAALTPARLALYSEEVEREESVTFPTSYVESIGGAHELLTRWTEETLAQIRAIGNKD